MTTKLSQNDMLAMIEDSGRRVTTPRRNIVALLVSTEEGFTSEEINTALPHVGRATVYRTIKLLVAAGVLCRVALPDSTVKYALAHVSHHHHTMCVKCGTVNEFRDSTVERLLRSFEHDIDGEIVGHRLELYIVCIECANTER